MNAKVKKILKWVIPAVAAAILLWVCFKDVSWESFFTALKSCDWGFVLLAMVFGVLSFWLRGVRWRMLLLPVDPHTKRITCFNSVNISYVANIFFPRLGEVVRCGFITRSSSVDEEGKKRASFDKVFGTVLSERLWDAIVIVVFFLFIFPFAWSRLGSYLDGGVGDIVSSRLNIVWLVLALVAALCIFIYLVWRLKDREGFFTRVWEFLDGIRVGILSFRQMSGGWLFILYSLLIWGCYWMTSVGVFWAVRGMDTAGLPEAVASGLEVFRNLDLLDVFILMFAGSLSSFIPVPGGFGAYHYVVSLTLSTVYGIPPELGIIFATISHEAQAITQIISGGLSYAYETFLVRDEPENHH